MSQLVMMPAQLTLEQRFKLVEIADSTRDNDVKQHALRLLDADQQLREMPALVLREEIDE